MIYWLLVVYQWAVCFVDLLHLLLKCIVIYIKKLWRVVSPKSLKPVLGETVLITGAGHGIGRELSLQFGRLGAKVICLDVNEDWNKNTVADIDGEGGIAWGYKCDVSSREEVAAVSQRIRDEVGDVTVLVNNAGIMPCKPFLKHSPEEIERIYRVNVFSHIWTIREWLPSFIAAGQGHIVALSSIAGFIGTGNLVPYCSSKFAVTGLMEGLCEELRYANRHPNIKITSVHPFVIDTGLAKKPRIRFPSVNPIVSPEKCAGLIIKAMRQEEEVVSIPSRDYYIYIWSRTWPRDVQHAFVDFMDCGVDEDD